jgi:uncharacterized protein
MSRASWACRRCADDPVPAPRERPDALAPPPRAPSVWPVLVIYLIAVVGILALSLVAVTLVHAVYPDLPEKDLALPTLLAGSLAASAALVMTTAVAVRPLDARRLRLLPGRETGMTLALVIVGTLALGQVLGAATALAGLDGLGTMAEIRRVLAGARGSELFAAVFVIGPVAGAAEEIFFRGFMQTALGAVWRPAIAVVVTAVAFALPHVEPIHMTLALGLGLWLGAVTERTGSALPAVAAHVVNNAVSALLTAQGLDVQGPRLNLAVGGLSAATFVAVVTALRRQV